MRYCLLVLAVAGHCALGAAAPFTAGATPGAILDQSIAKAGEFVAKFEQKFNLFETGFDTRVQSVERLLKCGLLGGTGLGFSLFGLTALGLSIRYGYHKLEQDRLQAQSAPTQNKTRPLPGLSWTPFWVGMATGTASLVGGCAMIYCAYRK